MPDPADLRARSTNIATRVAAFRELARSPKGRGIAWAVLRHTCERGASTDPFKRGSGYFEREIRQLGEIVAWADSKVTTQRSLLAPRAFVVHVLDQPADAEPLLAAELPTTVTQWGYRPRDGEPDGLRAHFLERERLIKANDVEGLRAYCDRTTRPLLSFDTEDRAWVSPAWTADGVLGEAIFRGTPELVDFALGLGPSHLGVRSAARTVLTSGADATVFARLLAALPDAALDSESIGGTLLASAARARRLDAVKLLLARGARPNQVASAFLVNPPFERAPDDGNGPMVNAVREGDLASLEVLLAGGGDPCAKTFTGRRVLDLAIELGDEAVIARLGATEAALATKDLQAALATKDTARVLELLPAEGTATALQHGAERNEHDLLRAVLASGVVCDAAVKAKALWHAAYNGHSEAAMVLVAHGADPNGFVALHCTTRKLAKKRGLRELAEVLKRAGGKLAAPARGAAVFASKE